MLFSTVLEIFETNWGWALALSGAMLTLTAFAASILNQDRKDSIALWLMGAQSEENWAKSFTTLFDAVFGESHLSLRCFIRSAIASLLAVVLIWALMGGWGGASGARLEGGQDLMGLLFLALAINVVADYVSLLETRWLLGWLSTRRPFVVQVVALIMDLLVSAAIIWVAIWGITSALQSQWLANWGITSALQVERDTLAETLGVFSPFSILFYSTFLTSLWSWAFIASTWILRLTTGLRLPEWTQLPNAPLRFLGLIMGGAVFLGSLTVATVLQQDEHGLTAIDERLCSMFQGQVCLHTLRLVVDQQRQLEMLLSACAGGASRECIDPNIRLFMGLSPEQVAQLWESACSGGDGNPRGCTYLGYHYLDGGAHGLNYAVAANFFRLGCEDGDGAACRGLGYIEFEGLGKDADLNEAAHLFRLACDFDDAIGCSSLALMYSAGLGVNEDDRSAMALYSRSCSLGYVEVCPEAEELWFQLNRNGGD